MDSGAVFDMHRLWREALEHTAILPPVCALQRLLWEGERKPHGQLCLRRRIAASQALCSEPRSIDQACLRPGDAVQDNEAFRARGEFLRKLEFFKRRRDIRSRLRLQVDEVEQGKEEQGKVE